MIKPVQVRGNPRMSKALMQLIARMPDDHHVVAAPSVRFLMEHLGMGRAKAEQTLGLAKKYNPNHDAQGRFSSAEEASGATSNPDGLPLGAGMTTSDWHSNEGLTQSKTHSYADWKEIKDTTKGVVSDLQTRFGVDLSHVELTSRVYGNKEAHAACISIGGRSVITMGVMSEEKLQAMGYLEARLQAEGKAPWSVNSEARIRGDREEVLAGTLRHELGHAVMDKTKAEGNAGYGEYLTARSASEVFLREVGGGSGEKILEYVAKHVSQYADRKSVV